MTKEEVLHRQCGYKFECEPKLLSAMDEYAKQQAIDFAKWTAVNLWSVHGANWYPYQDEDNPISADELYNQFIESQNKKP